MDNHASANKFPEAVDAYITTELKHRALVGPLQSNPFTQMHTSPMMTRPKPDSTRRLIVDLSWPLGDSVNSRIADNHFDGNTCSLKYPTIDQIVQQILTIGDQPLLFTVRPRASSSQIASRIFWPQLTTGLAPTWTT